MKIAIIANDAHCKVWYICSAVKVVVMPDRTLHTVNMAATKEAGSNKVVLVCTK